MADIFYTDATLVDDMPYIWPAAAPARSSRGLRNWHKFVMVYTPILAGLALLLAGLALLLADLVLLLADLVLRTGGNMAGAVVVAAGVGVVGLIAGLVVAGWAAKDGRL